MSDAQLLVNGNLYGGWKSQRITRGIEQIAGSFELGVSEMWPDQAAAITINTGARCEVRIDGETVITGWVDEVGVDYDADSHEVKVRGRDATGDLVDCAAIHKSGEWQGQTMLQIARDLVAPFGIKVTANTDVGAPFKNWNIQDGETVFENIDRMARHRAVLTVSDGKGGLLLTRAGQQRASTALVLGENIELASGTRSALERFSEYIVKGQQAADDLITGTDATEPQGRAADKNVQRYRPLIVIAETAADAAALQQRAEWERNVRAGRAAALTYTVVGWRHRNGLWQPNTIVPVRDAFLRTETDYLISQVRYLLDDEGGERAELSLRLPQAFDLVAIPETDDEDFLP